MQQCPANVLLRKEGSDLDGARAASLLSSAGSSSPTHEVLQRRRRCSELFPPLPPFRRQERVNARPVNEEYEEMTRDAILMQGEITVSHFLLGLRTPVQG